MSSEFLFSELLANKITSPYKQHAIVSVTGMTGTGKSYTALEIALETALAIVRMIGGKVEDYFTMDRIGIINSSEIERIMDRMNDRYSINILDDIGVGLNARKWQSKSNIIINDIVQTFRPNSNVLILTVPADTLIDKAVRERAHYRVEMQDPLFNIGLTQAKVFVNKSYNHGKEIRPVYLQDKYMRKMKMNFFCKPPKEYCDEYDRKRDEQFKILYEDRKKVYAEMNAEPLPQEDKKTKRDMVREIKQKIEEGYYKDMTKKQICEQEGISYQYFMNN